VDASAPGTPSGVPGSNDLSRQWLLLLTGGPSGHRFGSHRQPRRLRSLRLL